MESPTFKNFNPTNNADVATIKRMTDEVIAFVDGLGGDPRRTALAKTAYEEAAMWAVKAQFNDQPKGD